jgi:hypothetical protein
MDRHNVLQIRSPGRLDPVVEEAMARMEERYRDAAQSAATLVQNESYQPIVAHITDHLNRIDLDPDELAVLQVPGVYEVCLQEVLGRMVERGERIAPPGYGADRAETRSEAAEPAEEGGAQSRAQRSRKGRDKQEGTS